MTVTDANSTETTPVDLVTLTIDGVEATVPKGTLVIRAAELIGIEIPRFCDHPLLEPVGACRQCLVDVPDAGNGRGFPKPQASCTLEVAPGMVVQTQQTSPVAEKAQKGTLEFLLINHPLDCPVCDKGGECPLQNQAMSHGNGESRYVETKRTFPKPINVSAQVLLDRERCVLCQRCTRFSSEIAGDPFISLVERGARQQIGIAEDQPFHSYFSGNTIQICPVGALTSADYRFRSRPFDLISTPSIAEHDACGSAIRVDHRRGKVMRRLAGDDPQVNEEWITDKDRFAFTWAGLDRINTPLVRNSDGELEPASWPAALAIAARGLAAANNPAVLTGGRLTVEDAYAYAKFARHTLGTNNIDFRTRATTAEETSFLAAHVAGTGLGVTFSAIEHARTVVLVGLEPEDEAGAVFLRLRKAHRKNGTKVVAIASHATRGLEKVGGTLVSTAVGDEPAALANLTIDEGPAVILVGERLGAIAGALSAAVALAERTGASLAWVPRRAGDRGALEAGCLPNLLPGGRPVEDNTARADVGVVWRAESVPAKPGLTTSEIVAAAQAGHVDGLLVGGVDTSDEKINAEFLSGLSTAGFVVSLEVRHSAVTALADVVLPVAPPVEKAGTFINFEGRERAFEQVLTDVTSLPDVRVLAGIAEEIGRPIAIRTTEDAAAERAELLGWDGTRATFEQTTAQQAGNAGVVLDSWHQMIDDGRGQDGQAEYRATARDSIARASAATLAAAGVADGGRIRLQGPVGAVEFTAQATAMADGVVWAPANSGVALAALLGAGHGDRIDIAGGQA